jgi:hypothetical protein
MFSYQLRKIRNKAGLLDSIFEILPKRYALFAAGFLQTCKGITAPTTRLTSSTAANFEFFNILADNVFSAIFVVKD